MSYVPNLPRFDPAQVATVCEREGIRLLVLFGSRATGQPTPTDTSDLDLAVSFRPGTEPRSFWPIHEALSELFPEHTVDLAFLGSADPLFRWEIMRCAVKLWGDEDDFLELRAFAHRDFVDSADLRELEHTLSTRKLQWIRNLQRASP